jgi:hypothetical protein
VQSQFGRRLESVYAPAVLARFGSGAAQIAVRVVAPGGSAAYEKQLGQDVAARKDVAAQLLGNPRIQESASARAQLSAGEVDPRLLLMLPALANVHPVRVLTFGGRGPGADPAIPLCSADLATADFPAGMSQRSYAQWLTGYFRNQRPPYNAQVSAGQQQGESVVSVLFALPSPLGLIKGGLSRPADQEAAVRCSPGATLAATSSSE